MHSVRVLFCTLRRYANILPRRAVLSLLVERRSNCTTTGGASSGQPYLVLLRVMHSSIQNTSTTAVTAVAAVSCGKERISKADRLVSMCRVQRASTAAPGTHKAQQAHATAVR